MLYFVYKIHKKILEKTGNLHKNMIYYSRIQIKGTKNMDDKNINIQITEALTKYILQKNTKTINLNEIYKTLKLPYSPQSDKQISKALKEIQEKGYIEPLKTTKKNYQGLFEKYKIIKIKEDNEKQIKEEILKLDKKIKIDYLLKHPEEYLKNKDIIIPINNFLKTKKENIKEIGNIEEITANERSYLLYKNEKTLKEKEEILKKLGLTYKDLYCYETYEPFFYYINQNFQNSEPKNKTIIVIENKDTFWTIVNAIKKLQIKTIYMVIYGEGNKILKSFSFIEEFKINSKDNIYYFGDIDFEGINIYTSLKEKFKSYNISAYKKGYETILDIEKSPQKVRKNQHINQDKIEKFINEFKENYKNKLIEIFKNRKYIPQEVFNYAVALKSIDKH